jgi:hypothetical protein
MKVDRVTLWGSSVLAFALVLSLTLYYLLPGSLARVVLRFPEEITAKIVPEVRYLPFNWDQEHNVAMLVDEVLLGPARHDHQRLFSRQAAPRSVLVRDRVIYVDLKKASFIPDPDVLYSPETSLDVLKKTLLDNFRDLSSVYVSVDGQALIDKNR